MQTAAQARVTRRLTVGLRAPDDGITARCRTREIGTESLFLEGGPVLRDGHSVELTFADAGGQPLQVDCVVEAHAGGNLLLRYRNLDAERRARFDKLVSPDWDGADLLDGITLMSDRYGGNSLSDTMRLTSLLSSIQSRMASRRIGA
jgi:hypothetical protein